MLETEMNDPAPAGLNIIRSATLVGKSAAWAKRAKDKVAERHAEEVGDAIGPEDDNDNQA